MYKHVLRHWLEREPNLPIAFAKTVATILLG